MNSPPDPGAPDSSAALSQDDRYRLLVEAVTDYAIYMLDAKGVVTSWNPGAERFKGYSASEIIGSHFSRFYTDEDRQLGKPATALATAAREGKYESEGWRVRKDGSRFWAYAVLDAIKSPGGQLVGFAKITRDLTERKQAEEQLERTREALRQSQKMEAIGQLTGGIAHDFNNLLMAILGSLELARKRLPDNDPKLVSLIQNAIKGAERGRSLTQRMLAFARRQELAPEPLDLNSLFDGMSELLERALGPSINIQTRFPLTLPPLIADPNQLELAILNLAVNARDAMNGEGDLVISASRETVATASQSWMAPGEYVCLRVTDTGTGMDEETLRRATEPFFTTKGVGKGTGLGLSMTHGMAKQLGGDFLLHSIEGEGTTAEIWLPASSASPPPAEPGSATAQAPTRTLSILVVDDDSLVRMNTVAMLEDLGHRVAEAASGRLALHLLEETSGIDLVVTDQAMPGMTGTDLAERIRSRWPSLKLLLATGYAELPQGTTVFPRISKPFTQNELAEGIERTFRR